ncbi:vesicle-associated membrane protein 722-like [Tasmannia lanceolata]|uniref:vesicle-associated membrane protein 722-like n=1 Tax=Tasmannia lanceolata TaxID=3420 RepID=UPI004063D596
MVQKSLIYSCVARGTVILVEFMEFSGSFITMAADFLQKLPNTNTKFTYVSDGRTFNYLLDQGFTYCVVADESVGREIPMAFLERVKNDFISRYGGGKAAAAGANSLNKEFKHKLKEHMQYCADHPDEISKLEKVKAQVSEVKGVMNENIKQALERGGNIEVLVVKTDELRNGAQTYRETGNQLRRKFWLQNMKMKLIVLGILVALILIIVLSVCGGFNCGK